MARTLVAFRERIDTVVALLDGTAGLFAASEDVRRGEFAAFVERLQLRERYPGILGIGFSQRIAPQELTAVQARRGAEWERPFQVWPAGPRDEYHSIVFLEPLNERNRAAIGYDMFSEPTRRAAMIAARDSGLPRASAKVTLVQEIETQKQAGFLIYLAVYAGHGVPAEEAQRRARLLGFVYSPLRVGDLLQGTRAREIDYALYDGEQRLPAQLLRSTAPDPAPAARFSARRTIDVAGRPWGVEFRSRPEFESLSQQRLRPGLVLVALGTSALLAFIAHAQRRARRAAEEAARAQGEAAEAIHREHTWLGATLASIADAVVAVDALGRVVFINPQAGRLTGWNADEARGRSLSEVVRTVEQVEGRMVDEVQQSGAPQLGQLTLVARDGRTVRIDHSAAALRDRSGQESGAVIVMRDASQRLRHEQALLAGERRERERSRRLQLLAQAARTLAATPSEEALVEAIAAAARRLLDAPAAAVRQGAGDLAAEAGGLSVPLPGELGSIGTLSVGARASGPYDEDDRLLLGQLAGISAIALRNVRLYADLRETDRRKDEFLATLAHELRNPLAPIRTSLEIVRRAPGSAMAARALDVAERQTRHMVRLIEDLLDVSRISRGTIVLRSEPVPLAAVLEVAIETSRPLIESRGHRLTVAPVEPSLTVPGDATRLAQVFANLLNNAATYTPPGGRIAVAAETRGHHVEVTVSDNGIGIAPGMLTRVFDLFVQAERPGGAGGGLGIGLTLVRRLVELHGGTVRAHSAGPGQGAAFVVCLPRAEAPADAAAGADAQAGVHPQGLDVLVVDDNVDAAESLAVLLQADGHRVRAVHEGTAAVEAARQARPDVVLLDIGLPDMSGYEVARQLRRMHGDRPRLVAITGWGQPDDQRRAEAAGFDLHMVKPVDYNTLAGHLRRLMES